MAELALIASIVQVADVGIRLGLRLHTFGETVVSADRSILAISKDVTFTSSVLQELKRTFENDKGQIHSDNATETAKKVVQECSDIFQEMDNMLLKKMPQLRSGDPDRRSRAKTMLERLKWPAIKDKIQLLNCSLDRMKSTLTLMLNVIIYAQQVARKTEPASVIAEQRQLVEILAEVKQQRDEALAKAQRAIQTHGPMSTMTVGLMAMSVGNGIGSPGRGKIASPRPTPGSTRPDTLGVKDLIEEYTRLQMSLVDEVNSEKYIIERRSRRRLKALLDDAHQDEVTWIKQRSSMARGLEQEHDDPEELEWIKRRSKMTPVVVQDKSRPQKSPRRASPMITVPYSPTGRRSPSKEVCHFIDPLPTRMVDRPSSLLRISSTSPIPNRDAGLELVAPEQAAESLTPSRRVQKVPPQLSSDLSDSEKRSRRANILRSYTRAVTEARPPTPTKQHDRRRTVESPSREDSPNLFPVVPPATEREQKPYVARSSNTGDIYEISTDTPIKRARNTTAARKSRRTKSSTPSKAIEDLLGPDSLASEPPPVKSSSPGDVQSPRTLLHGSRYSTATTEVSDAVSQPYRPSFTEPSPESVQQISNEAVKHLQKSASQHTKKADASPSAVIASGKPSTHDVPATGRKTPPMRPRQNEPKFGSAGLGRKSRSEDQDHSADAIPSQESTSQFTSQFTYADIPKMAPSRVEALKRAWEEMEHSSNFLGGDAEGEEAEDESVEQLPSWMERVPPKETHTADIDHHEGEDDDVQMVDTGSANSSGGMERPPGRPLLYDEEIDIKSPLPRDNFVLDSAYTFAGAAGTVNASVGYESQGEGKRYSGATLQSDKHLPQSRDEPEVTGKRYSAEILQSARPMPESSDIHPALRAIDEEETLNSKGPESERTASAHGGNIASPLELPRSLPEEPLQLDLPPDNEIPQSSTRRRRSGRPTRKAAPKSTALPVAKPHSKRYFIGSDSPVRKGSQPHNDPPPPSIPLPSNEEEDPMMSTVPLSRSSPPNKPVSLDFDFTNPAIANLEVPDFESPKAGGDDDEPVVEWPKDEHLYCEFPTAGGDDEPEATLDDRPDATDKDKGDDDVFDYIRVDDAVPGQEKAEEEPSVPEAGTQFSSATVDDHKGDVSVVDDLVAEWTNLGRGGIGVL